MQRPFLFFMPCYLYIIYSSKVDRYYIGVSADIDSRLHRHNKGTSRATKAGAPFWVLKHSEAFPSRSLAMKREAFLKRMKSRSVSPLIFMQGYDKRSPSYTTDAATQRYKDVDQRQERLANKKLEYTVV